MGLVEEFIEVEISSSNIKHYENMGYVLPKIKRKNNKYVVPRGIKIFVNSCDLMRGSSERVTIQCDSCKEFYKTYFYSYSNYNHNGLCYCNNCSSKIFVSGKNSPRWNPNITQEERENGRYSEYYKSFIKAVFKRDKYTCQCCGKNKNVKLEAHHLDGYNWCIEKRTEVNNGITLCKDCHKDFHNKFGVGNNTKEQFEQWLDHAFELINLDIEITSRRKVYCLELDTVYSSCLAVAEEINSNETTVATVCSSYKNWKNNTNKKFLKSLSNMHYFWYDEYINLTEKDIQDYLTACKNKHFRKVICLTTNKIFNTINLGANYYNIKSTIGITRCCKNKQEYSGKLEDGTKLKWMYYEDYLKSISSFEDDAFIMPKIQ